MRVITVAEVFLGRSIERARQRRAHLAAERGSADPRL